MQLVVPRLLSLEPVPPSPRTSHFEARAQSLGVRLIYIDDWSARAARGYDLTPLKHVAFIQLHLY